MGKIFEILKAAGYTNLTEPQRSFFSALDAQLSELGEAYSGQAFSASSLETELDLAEVLEILRRLDELGLIEAETFLSRDQLGDALELGSHKPGVLDHSDYSNEELEELGFAMDEPLYVAVHIKLVGEDDDVEASELSDELARADMGETSAGRQAEQRADQNQSEVISLDELFLDDDDDMGDVLVEESPIQDQSEQVGKVEPRVAGPAPTAKLLKNNILRGRNELVEIVGKGNKKTEKLCRIYKDLERSDLELSPGELEQSGTIMVEQVVTNYLLKQYSLLVNQALAKLTIELRQRALDLAPAEAATRSFDNMVKCLFAIDSSAVAVDAELPEHLAVLANPDEVVQEVTPETSATSATEVGTGGLDSGGQLLGDDPLELDGAATDGRQSAGPSADAELAGLDVAIASEFADRPLESVASHSTGAQSKSLFWAGALVLIATIGAAFFYGKESFDRVETVSTQLSVPVDSVRIITTDELDDLKKQITTLRLALDRARRDYEIKASIKEKEATNKAYGEIEEKNKEAYDKGFAQGSQLVEASRVGIARLSSNEVSVSGECEAYGRGNRIDIVRPFKFPFKVLYWMVEPSTLEPSGFIGVSSRLGSVDGEPLTHVRCYRGKASISYGPDQSRTTKTVKGLTSSPTDKSGGI